MDHLGKIKRGTHFALSLPCGETWQNDLRKHLNFHTFLNYQTYLPPNDSSFGIIMMELKLTAGNAKFGSAYQGSCCSLSKVCFFWDILCCNIVTYSYFLE